MFGQLSCHSARLPSLFADCYLKLCCLWSPDWRPHKPSCKVMLSVVILRLFFDILHPDAVFLSLEQITGISKSLTKYLRSFLTMDYKD